MQQTTSNNEDYSIGDLDRLIESIKKQSGLNEEEICKAVTYNEGYISQVRSRGKVSAKFINALQNKFATTLPNANEVREPVSYQTLPEKSMFLLAESIHRLTDTNQRMANAILQRLDLLNEIKTNLDKMPDSMNMLTDLALKGQETMAATLLQHFDALKKSLSSSSGVQSKKTLSNQKR